MTCSRREFVASLAGAPSSAGLSELLTSSSARPSKDRAVIQILLIGGPSQIDTWDPKPGAPAEVRGPFNAIPTRWPGIRISELFPQMASRLNEMALLRSVYHDQAPIHETGLQLLQSGRAGGIHGGVRHLGQRLPFEVGADCLPWIVLPDRLGDTGVPMSRLQEQAPVSRRRIVGPFRSATSAATTSSDPMERLFTAAVESVLSGARLATVNVFTSVFGEVTWDAHGAGGRLPTTLDHYRTTICPQFDRAFVKLIDRLKAVGCFDRCLVIASGEFGRSPRLNSRGGRDHWPGVWTAILAGGGVRPGVYGSSDRLGGEPADSPVHAAQLAKLVANFLDLPLSAEEGFLTDSAAQVAGIL